MCFSLFRSNLCRNTCKSIFDAIRMLLLLYHNSIHITNQRSLFYSSLMQGSTCNSSNSLHTDICHLYTQLMLTLTDICHPYTQLTLTLTDVKQHCEELVLLQAVIVLHQIQQAVQTAARTQLHHYHLRLRAHLHVTIK